MQFQNNLRNCETIYCSLIELDIIVNEEYFNLAIMVNNLIEKRKISSDHKG